VTRNEAKGGSVGGGIGGGLYNLGTISIDATDLVFGNDADLYDDCFGCE
jgi:hypothetical protein